jgi:hypothetical protein
VCVCVCLGTRNAHACRQGLDSVDRTQALSGILLQQHRVEVVLVRTQASEQHVEGPGSRRLASLSRRTTAQWTLKFAKGQLEIKLASHTKQITLLHCTQCLAARWRQCVAKSDVCVCALVRTLDSGLGAGVLQLNFSPGRHTQS